MIYGVCMKCSHTRELRPKDVRGNRVVDAFCASCGSYQLFRVVLQIEQPDGSVVEVSG